MMLTSAEHVRDAARCRELGIAQYLTKPIRRAELQAAVARALSGEPTVPDSAQAIVRSQTDSPAGPKCRILLAEDNIVNQRVARHMMERGGHTVVASGNGREALTALENGAFDMVFMDVQMPELDGFEAAAEIRRTERDGHTHIPIIAITARAMTGDRERCLAGGHG